MNLTTLRRSSTLRLTVRILFNATWVAPLVALAVWRTNATVAIWLLSFLTLLSAMMILPALIQPYDNLSATHTIISNTCKALGSSLIGCLMLPNSFSGSGANDSTEPAVRFANTALRFAEAISEAMHDHIPLLIVSFVWFVFISLAAEYFVYYECD